MQYFKRYWNESHENWGNSWWFFETDDAGVVTRQIEIYENGPTLRYNESRKEDEFGGLSQAPLDLAEFASFEISQTDFEAIWMR